MATISKNMQSAAVALEVLGLVSAYVGTIGAIMYGAVTSAGFLV